MMISECGVAGDKSLEPAPMSGDNYVFSSALRAAMPKLFATCIFCQNWALPEQNGALEYLTDEWSITRNMLPATPRPPSNFRVS
jgi:hypothetical protein